VLRYLLRHARSGISGANSVASLLLLPEEVGMLTRASLLLKDDAGQPGQRLATRANFRTDSRMKTASTRSDQNTETMIGCSAGNE